MQLVALGVVVIGDGDALVGAGDEGLRLALRCVGELLVLVPLHTRLQDSLAVLGSEAFAESLDGVAGDPPLLGLRLVAGQQLDRRVVGRVSATDVQALAGEAGDRHGTDPGTGGGVELAAAVPVQCLGVTVDRAGRGAADQAVGIGGQGIDRGAGRPGGLVDLGQGVGLLLRVGLSSTRDLDTVRVARLVLERAVRGIVIGQLGAVADLVERVLLVVGVTRSAGTDLRERRSRRSGGAVVALGRPRPHELAHGVVREALPVNEVRSLGSPGVRVRDRGRVAAHVVLVGERREEVRLGVDVRCLPVARRLGDPPRVRVEGVRRPHAVGRIACRRTQYLAERAVDGVRRVPGQAGHGLHHAVGVVAGDELLGGETAYGCREGRGLDLAGGGVRGGVGVGARQALGGGQVGNRDPRPRGPVLAVVAGDFGLERVGTAPPAGGGDRLALGARKRVVGPGGYRVGGFGVVAQGCLAAECVIARELGDVVGVGRRHLLVEVVVREARLARVGVFGCDESPAGVVGVGPVVTGRVRDLGQLAAQVVGVAGLVRRGEVGCGVVLDLGGTAQCVGPGLDGAAARQRRGAGG